MTSDVQDFALFAGDACQPQILVMDEDGNLIPLQDMTEVIWLVCETMKSAPLLVKRKSDGSLLLPSGGVDAVIVPNILPADSATLCGYYFHKAKIFDISATPSTVTLGTIRFRRNVGGL